jgi:hypothetical protein
MTLPRAVPDYHLLSLTLSEMVMRATGLFFALLIMTGCGMTPQKMTNPVSPVIAAPLISAVMPPSAPAGSAGFTLTINGSNFGTDAAVYWNNSQRKTLFVSSNQLMTNISNTDLEQSGEIPVYVKTQGEQSNTVDFDCQ